MDTEPPRLTPVDSSAIAAAAYDAASRTLFLQFRSGGLYAYLEVPPATARAFEAAPSKGRFFQAEIDPVFAYLELPSPAA